MRKRLLYHLTALSLIPALVLSGCGLQKDTQPPTTEVSPDSESDSQDTSTIDAVRRPTLIQLSAAAGQTEEPSLPAYTTDSTLSNVSNADRYWFDDQQAALLAENLFFVTDSYDHEFYEIYEQNRYSQLPNYVTVDSMMHTYHLYFAYLMKHTERDYLANQLSRLSEQMAAVSADQYAAASAPAWKEAALRNLAFFSVAASLQNDNFSIPAEVADTVNQEIEHILSASAIASCSLNGRDLDYTQFKPRGYYDGDAALTPYFRAMMWYGQVGFMQSDESLDRSAALMTLALNQGALELWEPIYLITSFFAGASDDLTYYEYTDALQNTFGKTIALPDIEKDTKGWNAFHSLTAAMPAPVINSIPMGNDVAPDENVQEENKGFRFMGQRFTLDEAIFSALVYNKVLTNEKGQSRELPDTLDAAAALGSDRALEILKEQGDTSYEFYPENMESLRTSLASMPDATWNSSLYAGWLYTLKPLLEAKPSGYPSYMLTDAWKAKSIESFAGSYAELKHDTILYAKQVMVEMGGGDMETYDDRGYVEPEVEVWARFKVLSEQTRAGLKSYGLISNTDINNLDLLTELANQLLTISRKELKGEILTDTEYDLIRNFGGNLEHFWLEAVKEDAQSDYISSRDFPAALVADIASNASGNCLEVATGNPSAIFVLAPVAGDLRIVSGSCCNFYQFVQPSAERLTDTEWRVMMGLEMNEEGFYNTDTVVEKPHWTESYRYTRSR